MAVSDVPPPPPVDRPTFYVHLDEIPPASPAGISPHLTVQSARLFGCLGATIPARVRRARGELVVDLGKIVPPPNPCADAVGRAKGGVVLPALANGTTTVRLRYRGKEDRYRLVVAADSLQFSPLHTTFSQQASPQVLVRVPEGALHLQCDATAPRPTAAPPAERPRPPGPPSTSSG